MWSVAPRPLTYMDSLASRQRGIRTAASMASSTVAARTCACKVAADLAYPMHNVRWSSVLPCASRVQVGRASAVVLLRNDE
jgi:hypothetical protein